MPVTSGNGSPHFMTPTIASKRAELEKYPLHTQVPIPNNIPRSVIRNTFMRSAAKRVGFGRDVQGTPRSKKEGISLQNRAVSFPDKVRDDTVSECCCC